MSAGADFHAPQCREKLRGGTSIPRHRHRDGYVTVVISGGYQEAGFDGRRDFRAGSVVFDRQYDAHRDYIAPSGAELINLPFLESMRLPVAFTIDDPDAIMRLAETDLVAAAAALEPRRRGSRLGLA